AADSEHGDEPKQDGRRRDAAEVEPEVDGVQDAAKKVVEDQGQEQQAAPDQKAGSEYEVRRAHDPSATSDCILGRRSREGTRARPRVPPPGDEYADPPLPTAASGS